MSGFKRWERPQSRPFGGSTSRSACEPRPGLGEAVLLASDKGERERDRGTLGVEIPLVRPSELKEKRPGEAPRDCHVSASVSPALQVLWDQ